MAMRIEAWFDAEIFRPGIFSLPRFELQALRVLVSFEGGRVLGWTYRGGPDLANETVGLQSREVCGFSLVSCFC